jgi:hypothetical protein
MIYQIKNVIILYRINKVFTVLYRVIDLNSASKRIMYLSFFKLINLPIIYEKLILIKSPQEERSSKIISNLTPNVYCVNTDRLLSTES